MFSRRDARQNRGRSAAKVSNNFTPARLNGLDLWLRADQGITLASGTDVSAWADQSGGARNFTQGTAANQPAYQSTGGPGGRAAIYFAGGASAAAARYLSGPQFTGSAGEIFIVAKKDADPGTDSGGLSRFGSDFNGELTPHTDSKHYPTFGTDTRKTTGVDPGNHAAWFLLNMISASGEWTGRFNRSQYYTTATNTVAWHTTSYLGADIRASSSWWTGHIAAVIKYSRKLDAGERAQVENYISSAWGV